ncbi:sugar phosphate isomerase/epimerase (plasmid) [Paroceanicella profunda]|uniref:Sugar phosphate isomerase/epimerase n=1 Tax=Paroceanicella profunda TaxID=2579971 RepID=A0A5B8FJN3_9RHOB|nr:sugar phosphate isomerase/epimerase family protein [Paroceanicella profunda]QDL94637.1 sugar phosphate isomerase/epimerase [Paroceanicella profunda]
MPELSMCNELLAAEGRGLAEQCAVARALGYMGLELAPGTLGPAPDRLSPAETAAIARTVADHGLVVTGLHWLLAPFPRLSITAPGVAEETRDTLLRLVDLCAALGGRVMVHGSPGQRVPPAGEAPADTFARVADFFRPVAAHAAAAGLTYCIEPLSRAETPFINRVAEGAALAGAVESPAFRTMIDISAAGAAEAEPVAELIRRWLPGGMIGHVQANDSNRGAPGTGADPFGAIVRALRDCGWAAPIAVEPFTTVIDAPVTLAIGAATLRSAWEAAA